MLRLGLFANPIDEAKALCARVNLALSLDTSHPFGSLDQGAVGTLSHGGATTARLEVARGIDTFVFILVDVLVNSLDGASGSSRWAEGVSSVGFKTKVLSSDIPQLDLSGSHIPLRPLSSRSRRRVHAFTRGVEGRSGLAAFTRSSDFIGTSGAADSVACRVSRSAAYTFTPSSDLVSRTGFGAGGIASPSDPVVILASGASGTFGTVVDLASGGAGALTVLADKIGFTAYTVRVLFAGFGAFVFTPGVVGVGLLGRVVALTLTVHLERVGWAASSVFEAASGRAVVFAFSVIAGSFDHLVSVVTLSSARSLSRSRREQ